MNNFWTKCKNALRKAWVAYAEFFDNVMALAVLFVTIFAMVYFRNEQPRWALNAPWYYLINGTLLFFLLLVTASVFRPVFRVLLLFVLPVLAFLGYNRYFKENKLDNTRVIEKRTVRDSHEETIERTIIPSHEKKDTVNR